MTANYDVSKSTISAQLWRNFEEQFYCSTSGCKQTLTDSSVVYDCSDVKCSCIPGAFICGGGSTDISKAVAEVTGQTKITCPYNSSLESTSIRPLSCNLYLNSLKTLVPKGVTIDKCVFGECQPQRYNPSLKAVQLTSVNGPGVAAIVIIASIFCSIIGGLVIAKYLQIVAQCKSQPLVRAGVHVQFRDITYSAGYSSYELWKRRLFHGRRNPNLTEQVLQNVTSDSPKAALAKKTSTKHILHGVSGDVYPGQLLAVMGATGSGKSTLLDILAGKTKSGIVGGEIKVNGVTLTPHELGRISGFVDQEDIHLATVTVREAVLFSALLRLPESISRKEKEARVDDILKKMGLSHVSNSRIGGTFVRGISGGEKKRVSIAIELVSSPAIIFLDEPTSGLDSYTAHQIMSTLSNLARDMSKTIICTIHQPRSDIFAMFDTVLLIGKGRTIYFGPAKNAKDFFAELGYPCPGGYNPADHLLDVLVAEGDAIVEKMKSSKSHRLIYRNSIEGESESEKNQKEVKDLINKSTYSASFFTQIMVLQRRSFDRLVRSPVLLTTHVVCSLVLGLFVGGIYFNSQFTVAGVQNRLGSLNFLMFLVTFFNVSAIVSFSEERILFMRERSNGFYGPMPFLLVKLFYDIVPLRIVTTMLLTTISYFMINYSNVPGKFGLYIMVFLLFTVVTTLFNMIVGAGIRDNGTAILISEIVSLFMMVLSGLLINQNLIPRVLSWIPYLSFAKFGYEALAVNDAADIIIVDPQLAGIEIPAATILTLFGLNLDNFWLDVAVLCGYVLIELIILTLLVVFSLKLRK